MNILITGGTGFIGRHFIQQSSDDIFTVLTRDVARAKKVLGDSHHYVTHIDDIPASAVFDAVINLAGEPIVGVRWSDKQKDQLNKSRWDTTKSLVEWIASAEQKPSVFMSGSAIGFYGIDEEKHFDESAPSPLNDFASELCDRWEQEAKLAERHTRVVLLRTGVVLGADGGALEKMLLPFKMGLGGPVGSGKQWMSWIHMQDYLAAMRYLLVSAASQGAYNLTAPEPVRNQRFVKALASALHRPCWMPLPAYALKIALGEASTLLLDGQRVVPQKLLDEGFTFAFDNVEAAMKDLFA